MIKFCYFFVPIIKPLVLRKGPSNLEFSCELRIVLPKIVPTRDQTRVLLNDSS
jgi:hypothetical protein